MSTTQQRFSFPRQEMQMYFMEKFEYERAGTHWCLLDLACISWQLAPAGKKKEESHAKAIDQQRLWLSETVAHSGRFLASF